MEKLIVLLTLICFTLACFDVSPKSTCDNFKKSGYCKKNEWVRDKCGKTCGVCTPTCYDIMVTSDCVKYEKLGHCRNRPWMKQYCERTCKICGTTPTDATTTATLCQDNRPWLECDNFKRSGFCNSNKWVQENCKQMCGLCGTNPTNAATTTKTTTTATPGSCGISIVKTSRVIAGQKSTAGQWPWQIAMYKNNRFSCGGALITPQWIVTAAHCVPRVSPASLRIVLGDLHRTQKTGKEQTIGVSRVISHASYGNLNYDIALLKLSKPAQLNDHVRTVCLPKHGEHIAVGSKCYISGWGKTRHPGASVNELQHASLTIISKSECTKTNSKYARISDQMLCAKNGRPARQSGCHGDSGGPFVCQKNDGSWTLHGDVSWGSPKCDTSDASTVFARISVFRNWIDAQLRKY